MNVINNSALTSYTRYYHGSSSKFITKVCHACTVTKQMVHENKQAIYLETMQLTFNQIAAAGSQSRKTKYNNLAVILHKSKANYM